MYFEKKLYKLLNEADDVLDKMIKYKDGDGNEKEATVGGILKQGKDHPAHDDAQKTYDASKGDGGGEEPKKPAPKIDANPFDDEPAGDEPDGKIDTDDDVEIPDNVDDITDMLKKDSDIVDKMGDDVFWDGKDLVSSKFNNNIIASIDNDSNMTLGDLKKQIMDYEEEHTSSPTLNVPSYQDESKQPFKENYNRLFKGLGVSKGMRK